MKITVDYDRCDSHGNCIVEAPEVFDLDDRDIVLIIRDAPIDEHRTAVERAAAACPVAAIHIHP